jgi:5-methylcytosine-specific restriction endonuclease McrA
MLVYVLNNQNRPLMPTTPVKARILLKQRRAKIVRALPFTIQLNYETTTFVTPLTLGVDTGSSTLGSAVTDAEGNVLYMAEVELRNDITTKMEKRRSRRGFRRSRKTRYRPCRSKNRRNSRREDRITPTMTSKLHSHLREIEFVRSILPIAETIIEAGTFDPHALKNPDVLTNGRLYQQGVNYGFANRKAYVLFRDRYTCQNCAGKSGDKRLDVHHIIFRENGGSNDEQNLLVLCKTCHDGVHRGEIALNLTGKKKGALRAATQMNLIRSRLFKLLPDARETFGYITKEHRQIFNGEKTHSGDAIFIATQGRRPVYRTQDVFLKKCVSAGDYRQTMGVRSEKHIPTGKIMGFRKFDKVSYHGQHYFVKGRFSTGYAILMDIAGRKADLKPIPKFTGMTRVAARKSWIISQRTTASI